MPRPVARPPRALVSLASLACALQPTRAAAQPTNSNPAAPEYAAAATTEPAPAATPTAAPEPAEPPAVTPSAPSESLRRSGAYLLLSPGALSHSFEHAGETEYAGRAAAHTDWQWGLGIGGLLARSGAFAMAGGIAFQHATGKRDDLRAHTLRIGPELRIGASARRFFAYALLDFHGVIYRLSGRDAGAAATTRLTGIGGTFGAGLLTLLGKRFLLGAELKFPVDHLFAGTTGGARGVTMAAVDLRFMFGVKF